jgi:membrane fusion protein (multidrug efflux system)
VTEVTNETGIATAQADVEAAQAGLGAAERDHDAALARVRESEATNTKAQADVERYRPLAEKDEIPREQFDQVMATAKAQAATVAANQAAAEASLRQVDQKRAQVSHAQQRLQEAMKNAPNQVAIQAANVAGRRSSAEAARAQLDQALLNLSYSKIASPVDGIVAKRMAEVGDHVSPGQQLLLVAQIQDLWVTANFKETQIRRIHPGQSVRIHVDSLGRDFDGYVESMPAASGSVTSLLPPENATGNFVKVVQRLPVRIEFKKGQAGMDRLRPGMSVEPKVRVE